MRSRLSRPTALAQSVYYVTTGLWPILHAPTFIALTGPKRDVWLVKTFGLTLAALGFGLAVGVARRRMPIELAILGALTAGALSIADVFYVSNRTLRPVYLADALVEAALVGLWFAAASTAGPRA